MVERLVYTEEVGGSRPSSPTIKYQGSMTETLGISDISDAHLDTHQGVKYTKPHFVKALGV